MEVDLWESEVVQLDTNMSQPCRKKKQLDGLHFLNQHACQKEVWVCVWRGGCRTVFAMRSRSRSAFTCSLIKYTATFMRWCSVSLFISHLFWPYFPATSRNEEGWWDKVRSFLSIYTFVATPASEPWLPLCLRFIWISCCWMLNAEWITVSSFVRNYTLKVASTIDIIEGLENGFSYILDTQRLLVPINASALASYKDGVSVLCVWKLEWELILPVIHGKRCIWIYLRGALVQIALENLWCTEQWSGRRYFRASRVH